MERWRLPWLDSTLPIKRKTPERPQKWAKWILNSAVYKTSCQTRTITSLPAADLCFGFTWSLKVLSCCDFMGANLSTELENSLWSIHYFTAFSKDLFLGFLSIV